MPGGIKANEQPTSPPKYDSKSASPSPPKGGPRKPGPFGPSEPLYKLPQVSLARQDSIDDMKEAEDYVKKESINRDEKQKKLEKDKLRQVEEQRHISKEKEKAANAARGIAAVGGGKKGVPLPADSSNKEKGVGRSDW